MKRLIASRLASDERKACQLKYEAANHTYNMEVMKLLILIHYIKVEKNLEKL